jgi:hypothetical protein
MTIFDDLRRLYIAWSDRRRRYFNDSWQFVYHFAAGFGNYIGAPATYNEMSSGNNPNRIPTRWYVEPLQAIKDDGGEVHLKDAESHMDVVKWDGDGYWISGIRVMIDTAESAHPKEGFTFLVRFTLRTGQSELQIGDEADGKFEIDAEKPDSFKPAYEYMVTLLQTLLDSPPWNISEKTQIGFRPPQKETPFFGP